jgi:hypothetical protein
MTKHGRQTALRSPMNTNRANLNPFAHELDRHGLRCATDCPACRWAREKIASEVVATYGVRKDFEQCELFQIGLEELGIVPA